jgi:hypothetical protein
MEDTPKVRFLSLFVPDLEAATRRYRAVLGVEPSEAGAETPTSGAPLSHPFASKGPVLFDVGGVAIALYQCDMRVTHPGDVGIGLEVDGSPRGIGERAVAHQGKVFYGPRMISETDPREMAAFVLPDRHFFEVVGTSSLKAES